MRADDELDWQVLALEAAIDYGPFRVGRQKARHVASGRARTFSVIDCPNWVNALAVTDDQQAVFVRQYRPGVQRVTLELPGGLIEPGESPEQAAARELAEETGYRARAWHELGLVEPNPALQGNRCWTFLGFGADVTGPQQPDADEFVEVVTHPLTRVPELVVGGELTHSLAVAAFYLYGVWASGTA